MQKPVPASYGRASYYAEHAFRFTGADGTSRFGRYRWMPEAGEAYLSQSAPSRLVGYPFFPEGPRTRLHLKRDGIRARRLRQAQRGYPRGRRLRANPTTAALP
jgi:hypothetical protein